MNEKEFEKEKTKVKETLEILKRIIKDENDGLRKLLTNFDGDVDELFRLAQIRKNYIRILEASLDRPYFARIDFKEDGDSKEQQLYIGKNGIMNDDEILITDWRAPISSLYYDSEVGECSYVSPIGIISGLMSLKRQFEIESGELLEYFDVDLVSNDKLLQRYLNDNNDSRLKSIVSTIQKEQNDLIRKRMSNNLIVQGVAGSGKSTVALHRIAYLVYNNKDTIKQNQYLVIGPNSVFLKYIKSVLPELDVDGVKQCTFEEFVKNYIGEDININSSDKKLGRYISGKDNGKISKFKCSLNYKEMIDNFVKAYITSLTSKPIKIGDFELISSNLIKEIFESTDSDYSRDVNNRIEKTIDLICKMIEEKNEYYSRIYSDYTFGEFKKAKTEQEKNKMRDKFYKGRNEISKNCRSTVRKYFDKNKLEATKLYKIFMNNIEDYDIYNFDELNKLKKETLENIKNNSYDFEDLSALAYIKLLISTDKEIEKLRHVVIDEAQDYGQFNFFLFKKAMPQATFSIFGDLAQSIYDYRGIDSWDEVNNHIFDNKADIINIKKSYRTTAEIMDVADSVAESIGLDKSEMVVRHGNEVSLTSVDNSLDIPKYVLNKINEYKEKGYKTIAVISKTNLLSNYMNDDLSAIGMKLPNISLYDDLSDPENKICTISNQLAKGLEFDAVIINNANEKIYSSNRNLDMKLLYVALTRALHELDIVYSGELTKPLSNYFAEQKKPKKLINKIK